MESPPTDPAAGIWVVSPRNGRFREATAAAIPPWGVGPYGEPPVLVRAHDGLGQTRVFSQWCVRRSPPRIWTI
jgi:hypothetical protein